MTTTLQVIKSTEPGQVGGVSKAIDFWSQPNMIGTLFCTGKEKKRISYRLVKYLTFLSFDLD